MNVAVIVERKDELYNRSQNKRLLLENWIIEI